MDPSVAQMPGYCDRNAAANTYLTIGSITLAIASVVVPLRMYVRLKIVQSFWWDDVFILLAFVLMIVALGVAFWAIKLGIGRHLGCYSMSAAIEITKLEFVTEEFELLSVLCARISAAIFVIRLFGVNQMLKRFLYGYIAFVSIFLGFTAIAVWVECTPVTGLWNPMVPAKCWSEEARNFINYFNGVVSVIGDLLPALLPLYFLANLQMNRSHKIAVGMLMGLGIIPGICAIARTAVGSRQTEKTAKDPIYNLALLGVFGIAEMTLATICATIPALPPLFTREKRLQYSDPRYRYDDEIKKYRRMDSRDGDYLSSGRSNMRNTPATTDSNLSNTLVKAENVAGQNNSLDDLAPLVPLYGIGKRTDISIYA